MRLPSAKEEKPTGALGVSATPWVCGGGGLVTISQEMHMGNEDRLSERVATGI